MPEPGDKAPDFTLPDQHGNAVALTDLRGKEVVLYFYPKADTPGCTTQACGVRDHRSDYKRAGAVVLGISPDPVKRSRSSTKVRPRVSAAGGRGSLGRRGVRRLG